MKATVVVPTIAGRGPLLPLSVGSILRQTTPDLEVFIMGDGVCDETRAAIHALMQQDDRVRFFDHPKHQRRGEPYRHAALAEARGEIVCYLCDRDLMWPHHVATLHRILTNADFAHSLVFSISPVEGIQFLKKVDVAQPDERRRIEKRWEVESGVPLSFGAHTLAAYRRLPFGWRTTPSGHYTDLYMWQQFISQPSNRIASSTRPTILYFPTYLRSGWSVAQRLEELQRWEAKLSQKGAYETFLEHVLAGLMTSYQAQFRALRPYQDPVRRARRTLGLTRRRLQQWLRQRGKG